MRRLATGIVSATLLLFSASCSQSDQDRAKREAERARDRAEQAAKRLADKTKDAASEISDKTKSALNDSDGAARSAESKMRNGVKKLEESSETASKGLKESAITAKVKSRIVSDVGLNAATHVSVETIGHTVTLTGTVPSEEKKREVEKAALAVDGVTKINNRLAIE